MANHHPEPLALSGPLSPPLSGATGTDPKRPFLRAGRGSESVKLDNLSSRGFRTDWPNKLALGDSVWLKLPGLAAMPAKVTWELDNMIGCTFDVRLHPALYAQSLEIIADAQRSVDLN